MLMAVGAAMAVKWTAGGAVGSMRRMKVIEISGTEIYGKRLV